MASTLYVNDSDGIYPPIRFSQSLNWYNVVLPYVKSKKVFSCPSNPDGQLTDAEGYESEKDHVMYRSYGFNSCAASYHSMDGLMGTPSPPLNESAIPDSARVIQLAEQTGPSATAPDFWPATLTIVSGQCGRAFEHGGQPLANFLRFDGHASSAVWRRTLLPVESNGWELDVTEKPGTSAVPCEDTADASFDTAMGLCPDL